MTADTNFASSEGRAGPVEDLRQLWLRLPARAAFLVLVTCWVLLFVLWGNSTLGYAKTSSLFGWWAWVHSRVILTPDGSFSLNLFLNSDVIQAWLVPLVVLALLWSRRRILVALPKRVWWPALSILVLAILLHLIGFMIQQTRLSVVGFLLGIFGLMGLCWGPAWLRECLFPFLLFAFCVPLPNGGEFITFRLRNVSAELSTFISRWLLGMDVFRNGTSIISANGNFQYDVAPACSGIRSLVTLLALTTIFGYLTFAKLWKRFLVVLLAAPLAVAGNTVRITGAVLVGEIFGQEAGAKVEQNLGFVTFLIALAVLFLVAHWLREEGVPSKLKDRETPSAGSSATASAASPSTPP